MIDKNLQTLYVGKTRNLKKRFYQHKKDKAWWNQVDCIEFSETSDFLIDIYEIYYINKFHALYNKKDTNIKYTDFNLKNLNWRKYE